MRVCLLLLVPLVVRVSANSDMYRKKLQEQSLGPGDLRRGWPPPGALKRGSSGRHSGDLAPTVEDVRPGLGLT
ncbi:hypothetical protein CesoFtcFv8_019089 [Champsocephalus esox]|uniref:Uncharacterized protein n=2 Tax=Champsocephalus TaxID=52236 RepID=A0AAN8D396_CHAGU|nr:hypothetical protein CesoFtcFv8_019089 [Champsocephalus esox]KAK5914444.1 hypothetical protein CgunFtcFv8_008886 [Champsocephalus gunnari]